MTKEVLIDAIVGKNFDTMNSAIEAEKLGFASFTGNQHNPDWQWNKSRLAALDMDDLEFIYKHGFDELIKYKSEGY